MNFEVDMQGEELEVAELLIDLIDPLSIPEESDFEDLGQIIPILEEPKAPYFLVDNLLFDKELEYFITEEGLPVYFFNGSTFKLVGNMQPFLDTVLRAKFLDVGLSYVDRDGEKRDLDDPSNLLTFIHTPSDFVFPLRDSL